MGSWWSAERRGRAGGPPIPSPNIWHWPDVYEVENRAQDADGLVLAAMREVADWTGRDVVDVGCGDGFHLLTFAGRARSTTGVEPHLPLVARGLARLTEDAAGRADIQLLRGSAESLPLEDACADVVHARTAYFFGPGCEPGIVEAMRVLRPGGTLVVIDLDATAHPYGSWMRADLKNYHPESVERFFAERGFGIRRIDTTWQFESRRSLREVLGIEFSRTTADRAFAETPGLALAVRYRLHWLVKPPGPVLG